MNIRRVSGLVVTTAVVGGLWLPSRLATKAAPPDPPAVIGFDDLAAGTAVSRQYPGVVFLPAGEVITTSTSGLPTRSSPNALGWQCTSTSGTPLQIRFDNPQASVRVYIGNRESSARTATLTAYGTLSGAVVGAAEVLLPPRSGATQPLAISRLVARDIRRVEIRMPGCALIDDLTPALTDLPTITTIDFDDRPADSLITTQYPGVVFVRALDGPRIKTAASLGTRTVSPPNVLQHHSFEFGSLQMTFTSPRSWVRAFVGNDLSRKGYVIMRAYSSASPTSPIATTYVNLPARSPITAPLEVSRLPETDIHRIEIDADEPGVETIDNLQFGGGAPPIPVVDTTPPQVFIDTPRTGGFSFLARPPLRGRIVEDRGLESVTLVVERIDGFGRHEERSFLTQSVTGGPPTFTFDTTVPLFTGQNRIRIEARDTAGNPATNLDREVIVTRAPPMEVIFDSPPVSSPAPFVTRNPFPVRGRVRKLFGTLTRDRVRIQVTALDGRTSTLSPVDSVTGAAPEFSFQASVNLFDSSLVAEPNWITIEARSEDGQAVQRSVYVSFRRPDVSVSWFDLTQAMDATSLVAGKRTVARVTPTVGLWEGGPVTVTQAQLLGRRGGVELPGSPLTLSNPIEVLSAGPGVRRDAARTWNFLLPDEWTREGSIELTTAINTNGALQECAACRDNNTVAFEFSFRFFNRSAFRVVPIRLSVNGTSMPAASTIGPAFEAVQRVYPTATVDIRPSIAVTINDSDINDLSDDDEMEELAELIEDFYPCPQGLFVGSVPGCDVYYYGMVASRVGGRVGTAADSPSRGAWGWVGLPFSATAHELGHCLGREHAPGHGEEGTDDDFPYPHGEIGPHPVSGVEYVGFDTVAMQAIPSHRGAGAWPPGVPTIADSGGSADNDHAHDFMSYGPDPIWISDYTWRNLFDWNFGATAASSVSATKAAEGVPSTPRVGATIGSRQVLTMRGRIRGDGTLVIRDSYTTTLAQGMGLTDGAGPYRIEVQDRAGKVMATMRFQPRNMVEDPDSDLKRFKVTVPLADDAFKVRILNDREQVVALRERSPSAPEVRLLQPTGGEKWPSAGKQAIVWSAFDRDGDSLSYALQYSVDDGKSWRMIASKLKETSYDLDVSWLPGSERAKLRVMATDGLNTTRAESDGSFAIPRKKPEVIIFAPEDNSVLDVNQGMAFEGTASDYEDEWLPDESLQWSSDREGRLGSGRRVDVSELSPGVHAITLSAQDSDGDVGHATVRVRVPARTAVASLSRLDGWVDNGGKSETRGRILVGNGPPLPLKPPIKRRIRGFVSFDISSIPQGHEVVDARLEVFQAGVTGDPYVSGRRGVTVDVVDYGAALDAKDYFGPVIEKDVGRLSHNDLIETKTLDVKNALARALVSKTKLFQVRLRLSPEVDSNKRLDVSELDSADSGSVAHPPRLVVTHAPRIGREE